MDAVRTCILSSSWRFLGTTRPKIEFHESHFRGNKEKFMSVLDNTLQRYFEQNLLLQELILGVPGYDCSSVSVLNKWLPIVLMNMGVKVFSLSAFRFPLPLVVLQAEFLEELHLIQCNLNYQTKNNCIVKLHMLKRLSLRYVWIEEETFEKIMSSCPLIQHLVLESCRGLSNVKVNEARNLKHFEFYFFGKDGTIVINDAPSLETIHIKGCYDPSRYHLHNNYFSPCLKSLFLDRVHLPTELLNSLSTNLPPCLEKLVILQCSGFSEFKLSSRSIERLIIRMPYRPIETAINIDAANILYFEFVGSCLPSIFSFATTSRECKSCIEVHHSAADALTAWSLKLHEFLKALSQSQISLDITKIPFMNQDTYDGDICCEPVAVEHLNLREFCPSDEVPTLLNCLFRICRPTYIGLTLYYYSRVQHERQNVESLWKTLVKKVETSQCNFWQQDLEETSIQVLDKNEREWRSCQECEFSNNEEIRFRLKWRD